MDENPYAPINIDADASLPAASDAWTVYEPELYTVGPEVILPQICHATQHTTNLVSYDVKLQCSSSTMQMVWVVLICAFWVPSIVGSDIQSQLVGLALVLGLILYGVSTRKSISLRVYESKDARNTRTHAVLRSRVIKGAGLIAGVLAALAMNATNGSSSTVAIAFLLPMTVGLVLPSYVLNQKTMLRLRVTQTSDGRFRINGFRRQFLSALTFHQSLSQIGDPR